MLKNPKISICIPIHDMQNSAFFLKRCIESIEKQTYKNYEVVITTHGKMAENTNEAIKRAKGDIIKILYMDDYLATQDSLQRIADNFKRGWLVTGCAHDYGDGIPQKIHLPKWNENIVKGENTIGSPSVLSFENKDPELFDEKMSWLLDCDLYHKLYKRYGEPTTVDSINVIIGVGTHQMTNILTNEEKLMEHNYLETKYV